VLSEVTPPTALSPFAAAAITGGNPYRTTMMAWKYTMVAFVVPFMFTLAPAGLGLLLIGGPAEIAPVILTASVGVAALVGGVGGWVFQPTNLIERALLIVGGLALFYPAESVDLLGLALVAVAVALQWLRRRSVSRSELGTAA
jgi:TRAP-type uncharacterized transport system fused permease subunit